MALALLIAGVACVLYGVAVMLIWSGTWFFAFWYVLGALFLGAAWALHSGAWHALPSAARHAACAIAVALMVGFAVTQGLILKDFGDRAEEGLDYLVVLGAQVREDRPSAVLAFRLDTAAAYLEANPRTRCIVSGGRGPNELVTEASVMASYLEGRGIDPGRILVEDRSLSTKENIENCLEYFDPARDSVGIVTNNFHLFRALGIARKSGIAHVCGQSAPSSAFYLPNNMARESLGIAKEFLVGNM